MKFIYVLVSILVFSFSSYANKKEFPKKNIVTEEVEAEAEVDEYDQIKISRLKRIHHKLVSIRSQINTVKAELKTSLDMMGKIRLESKLIKLQKSYEKNKYLFIEAVTKINLNNVLVHQHVAQPPMVGNILKKKEFIFLIVL